MRRTLKAIHCCCAGEVLTGRTCPLLNTEKEHSIFFFTHFVAVVLSLQHVGWCCPCLFCWYFANRCIWALMRYTLWFSLTFCHEHFMRVWTWRPSLFRLGWLLSSTNRRPPRAAGLTHRSQHDGFCVFFSVFLWQPLFHSSILLVSLCVCRSAERAHLETPG